MLMGLVNWGNFYIYLIANVLGGAVAAIAFTYLNPDDVGDGPLARRAAAARSATPTATATATGPSMPASPAGGADRPAPPATPTGS
jgi:hypothetical protein